MIELCDMLGTTYLKHLEEIGANFIGFPQFPALPLRETLQGTLRITFLYQKSHGFGRSRPDHIARQILIGLKQGSMSSDSFTWSALSTLVKPPVVSWAL